MTDDTRCRELVYSGIWNHRTQCKHKPWRDGYCRIHHPDSVEKRQRESDKRFREKMDNNPLIRDYKKISELEKEILEKEILELKAKIRRAEDEK